MGQGRRGASLTLFTYLVAGQAVDLGQVEVDLLTTILSNQMSIAIQNGTVWGLRAALASLTRSGSLCQCTLRCSPL